ncbi:sensor histidine kinase [Mycolicibacterium chitae]|uniref:Oxygen sensor histidine kinase NreB n=1 Tax=Mycolicibacterium chitae TaxID=1792 RepID=A0A448I905_MYCCI|nr:GAF domain-containing sensor histidine kinase [Mycolicibacterium chitae]MCV7105472.1 GAF domain-containing sensor histidine kinase [Mycolicibacterium chitae]BBZ05288.1 sensor histidine kinase [Mycolicibacterium chitae]VEG48907.1 GAF sensor signal transduction histidine kinase [Mycolicibacterium chitae]
MTGLVHGLVDEDREVELLLGIVAATSSGPGVESLAAAVAELITSVTASDVCFVHVLDDSGRSLTLAGATPPFDEQVGLITMPLGEGVSGWVASHRAPVVITDNKDEDSRYVPIASLRGSDFTSMASVPMQTELGGLVGVLNVHTVARHDFTGRDIELLLAIGRLLAGALDQARMHRQVAARERAHENFAEQVIAAQESERRRLAGDIHDGISQRLVSLTYRLDAAARAVGASDGPEAADQLEKARDLVDLTLAEARAAIGGLRPPVLDDLGLVGGLASLASSIPEIDLDLELADRRLPEHVEVALYRIAQECLQNVVKHARAMTAKVWFEVDDGGTARLEVSDNGVGFDPAPDRAPTSYGMLSMSERAELVGGQLSVRSRPGWGTTVTVTVPVDAAADHAG